ncbi:MAG: hypothetical protein ACRDN9_05950 [Streptosporangiaceae bacterium]
MIEKGGVTRRDAMRSIAVVGVAPAAYPASRSTATTSDQRLIYVSDGEEQLVWTVGHKSGRTIAKFGEPEHMAGQFTFVHTLATDSRGDLYTGETIGGRRVQKFKVLGAH